MIFHKLPDELKSSISTLKSTSFDKKKNEYMTESNIKVLDFDKVKDQYIINNLSCVNPNPMSNDALYISNNNRWIFIEFKNGNIGDSDNFKINKKIYDSLAILFDIMINNKEFDFQSSISFARKNMDYILVYNKERNEDTNQTRLTKQGIARQVKLQKSESRDIFKKIVSQRAGQNLILFGLDQFKGYFFSNVYTYTKEEFEKNFVEKYKEK